MKWREQWDRYWWPVAAGIFALLAARIIFGREPFCAVSKDEHCFREWVSAVGGWVAVGVAIPTLLYMQRQITDARLHHRQSIMQSSRERIEAAREAIRAAGQFKIIQKNLAEEVSQASFEPYPVVFISALSTVEQLVDNAHVEAFLSDAPKEISRSRERAKRMLKEADAANENYMSTLDQMGSDERFNELKQKVAHAIAFATFLAHKYQVGGERYLKDLDALEPHA